MTEKKKPTTKKAAPKKSVAKKAAPKKSTAKTGTTGPKKAAPKKKPVEVVLDVADDFVDREKLSELVAKVDEVVDQDKIKPAVDQAQEVISDAVAEVQKKVSWLKKLFGKKK